MPTATPMAPAAPTTRRALLAGAGVGAAALLAACTQEAPRTGSGLLWSSQDPFPSGLPELAQLLEGREQGLELPGLRYRVQRALRLPSLPRAAAATLGLPGGTSDGESEDGASEDGEGEVHAPEGEEFLLAELQVWTPALMSPDLPEVDVRREAVVLGGRSTALGEEPVPPGAFLRLLLTVPTDAGAEPALLEVTCGDVAQRLNLENGSRVSSDLEHWYTHWYQAVPEPRWIERADERAGSGTVLSAGVTSSAVAPALPDGTWPAPGTVLLGIGITAPNPPDGVTPRCAVSVLLPGGEAAPVRGEASWKDLTAPTTGARLWCEVPHDAEAVSVRIDFAVTTAEGEEIDLGEEEIPVVLQAIERPDEG